MANPIVIFDSGVGGLSVYQEIRRALPTQAVVYCSDAAGFPYGSKPQAEVIERTSYCLARLAEQYCPSLAVIACNTASTIALPRVRAEHSFPVVGVVPAIKTAGEQSRNHCIGLLATPGTIERPYTQGLIDDFAQGCQVVKLGSSELVTMAEQHLRGESVSLAQLAAILRPFFIHQPVPDTIVLGCTHFPLLRQLLGQVSPAGVRWVDSGSAIARRVVSLVGKEEGNDSEDCRFVYTGQYQAIADLVPTLEKLGFSAIAHLESV